MVGFSEVFAVIPGGLGRNMMQHCDETMRIASHPAHIAVPQTPRQGPALPRETLTFFVAEGLLMSDAI